MLYDHEDGPSLSTVNAIHPARRNTLGCCNHFGFIKGSPTLIHHYAGVRSRQGTEKEGRGRLERIIPQGWGESLMRGLADRYFQRQSIASPRSRGASHRRNITCHEHRIASHRQHGTFQSIASQRRNVTGDFIAAHRIAGLDWTIVSYRLGRLQNRVPAPQWNAVELSP